MKTCNWRKTLAALAVAGLTASASTALAQNSPATNPAPTTTVSAPEPQLAYGVPQILQLAQAKISDNTIIAYIKNSGISYGLNASQIIYLRQQGISDAVITTMLNQPSPAMASAAPQAPAVAYTPPPAPAPSQEPVQVATPAPTVTYIQSTPPTTYYYEPYYYPAYYPAYGYGFYPPVSFSFGWGWGGGWRGGGGWHGGGFGGGRGGWHH
jgi:hypothetical protein